MREQQRVDGEERRPDPDELLARLGQEQRGKLTVFLGAAAGVGKTYAMLETAQERRRDGVDVVVGWVETHGRQETEALTHDLPRIPPRALLYKGKMLYEMDVDAILQRRPDLVLVDELAHTNVPGSRNVRRFQDVEELLQAGVDVYTTVNVQHIESLNDIVARITGVIVRETVPDRMVEQADTVQLIDIPPQDLIKRLQEGKVYVPDQAENALRKFFRPGNINALRELALRLTAQRVDKDLHTYMQEHRIAGPWPASERVMVCVSPSPFSGQLIRTARRLAEGLQTEWLAVHVETSRRRFPMGERERDRLARNMRLVEELGGRPLTVVGENLVEEILETARANNVTSIVIGKPRHGWLREWLYGPVVDRLIRRGSGINFYVIQGETVPERAPRVKTAATPATPMWWQYGAALAMVAAITAVGWRFLFHLEIINMALLYLLPVVLTALWWGRWPSYCAAVAGVMAFDFLFVPPLFTFSIADVRYVWSFATFLLISFLIGGRTENLRREATWARQREKSVRTLYDFSREVAGVVDVAAIADILARMVAQAVDKTVVVLLPDAAGKPVLAAAYDPEDTGLFPAADKERWRQQPLPDEGEHAVASWAYEKGRPAGRSTDTLPGAQFLYLPLRTKDTVVGVLGIHLVEKFVTPEEHRLINGWVGVAAVAVERAQLARQARQAAILLESDRLRTALLNSISHELRTPLSFIIGAVSTLLDGEERYSPLARRELLENIQAGAVRMDRLVANLLDTARLESGMLRLKDDWCDIEDIIGTALRQLGAAVQNRPLHIAVAPDVPLLKGDCVLLTQVLVNLLDNAVKYSPPGGPLDIAAVVDGKKVLVTVADRGGGVPAGDLSKIFDKFYRVQHPQRVGGTGLGLAICKGIVECHNGRIWAENRPGGGMTVNFTLPLPEEKYTTSVTDEAR